ncbi:MAG: hypothetical protein NTZ90_17165 [Proteobacteria bacterium]|nr:hypothetical protein [Pseudomonadota bacterium]
MKQPLQLSSLDPQRLNALLAKHHVSLADSAALAGAVRRLSDHYLQHPEAATPWRQDWAQIAYACYFLPLNYLRVLGVLEMAQEVGFFAGLRHYSDFGSGLGAVSLALDSALPGQFLSGHAIEVSSTAIAMHRQLTTPLATPLTWSTQVPDGGFSASEQRLASFSFSLTELPRIPAWALQQEALMLIEPATNQDSRRLLAWRGELLDAGWHIWAPCTHAGACPLLTESKRDWCHDRVQWVMPEWFQALEENLPMRNDSLTYSYLLMRRTAPSESRAGLARLTGDLRREKGASRQMICRGSKREFLSWQHRRGEAPQWPRGERVILDPAIEVKSNELRPTTEQVQLAT